MPRPVIPGKTHLVTRRVSHLRGAWHQETESCKGEGYVIGRGRGKLIGFGAGQNDRPITTSVDSPLPNVTGSVTL